MLKEREAHFIETIFITKPSQLVENIASDSHETRRFPDPYIFVVNEGKVSTPSGELVEKHIDTTSYLGRVENKAFQQIQQWADENDEGITVWFSPPFKNRYPVSKIIISEISKSDNTKLLFNRAVVLDIDERELLDLANEMDEIRLENPESLRAIPFFPTHQEFTRWFDKLGKVTSQTELITSGVDVEEKTETLATISDIHHSVAVAGKNTFYAQIHDTTREMGLIGTYRSSCPTVMQTAFQAVFENSAISEVKYVKNCGNCGVKIESKIGKGYKCKSCGGIYEGC